jgi:peptidoglycan/xylan/chitin deacetylase (PgdA/CDA1 family)
MKGLQTALITALLAALPLTAQDVGTVITKWQDGKAAAVSITFDDSTINQFRIALPMLNERGLPSTFFVITGEIPGSEHRPTFVGRPIMDIVRESATIPTSRENAFERSSMLRYLGEVQQIDIVLENFNPNSAAGRVEKGDFAYFDNVLTLLRNSGQTYALKAVPPVRSQETGRPPAIHPGGLTWDEFRRAGRQGHEIGNHLVSHAHTPGLDEANILYEAMKADEDIRAQMGDEHAFSIEASYGIHDPRVERILVPRFPLTRNWVTDPYIDGIFRGDNRDPAAMTKEYVQWQRGPITKTTVEEMKRWVDTSLATGTWLVLVIHGVEGIGYQPIPAAHLREYFDYMKANENRLWVATFRDAARYARERMASNVATTQAGATIEVTVTHSLDPKLYALPLTARTTVPSSWTSAEIRQGSTARTVPVQRDGTAAFVMYRITPNAGVARLQRK